MAEPGKLHLIFAPLLAGCIPSTASQSTPGAERMGRSRLPVPPVLTVLVRAFLAGRTAQAETEKELHLWTLMPYMLDKVFKGKL